MKKHLLKDMNNWAILYTGYFEDKSFKIDNDIYENVETAWGQFFVESLIYFGILPNFSKKLLKVFKDGNFLVKRNVSSRDLLIDFIYSVMAFSQSFNLSSIIYCSLKFSEFIKGKQNE